MALKYFGTDGIRGEYGGPSLNDGIAFRAGVAMARLLKQQHEIEAPLMVVGRDTRASGLNLTAALGAEQRAGISLIMSWATVRLNKKEMLKASRIRKLTAKPGK